MNHKINKEVIWKRIKVVDYKEAWDLQEKLFSEIIDLKINNRKLAEEEQVLTPNYVISCQHPHVYTLGKSGKPDNLLLDEVGLEDKDAKYYKINRGGDITYHGPGQLIVYPLLDLDNFFTDIHKYMRFLEESVILTCRDFGLDVGRIKGLTGVWLDYEKQIRPRKICAMGVKTSRWVSMHGLALNVNTDLDYFKNIVPCGIADKEVTSMSNELGFTLDFEEVESILLSHLSKLFEMNLLEDKEI